MDEKSERWWNSEVAVIMLAVLFTVSGRLIATHWTSNLGITLYVMFIGYVLGLALGQSRLPAAVTRLFGVVYTLILIPWILGANLTSPELEWIDRLAGMAQRIESAWNLFALHQPVYDPILFLLLMGFLFWLVSMAAGYYLTRHGSPWMAILPAGVVLIVVNHYDRFAEGSGRNTVALFLFLVLVLLARVTFLRYRSEWRRSGTFVQPEAGLDLWPITLGFVFGLMLLANIFGSVSAASVVADQQVGDFWTQIGQPWDHFRQRISDAFASLRSSEAIATTNYEDDMALGTGSVLGDNVVFTVYSASTFTTDIRNYWKARSYDSYTKGHWTSTITVRQPANPNSFNLTYPFLPGRNEVEFLFHPISVQFTSLYSSGEPAWFSRAGQAITIATGQELSPRDLVAFTSDTAVRPGDTFDLRAWVGTPTIGQLTKTSTDYPTYVKDLYLALPTNLSPRFKELATQITAGMSTPYDKIIAITRWLRNNITYQDPIPNPPPGRDPVEWFLFDYKKGYCNYYASAEVLLLRTLGIPARIAVGYAQGEYNQGSGMFTVRQKDSHAWPEVYFTGIGWEEFEPTVSQDPRVFPEGDTLGSGGNPTPDNSLLGRGNRSGEPFPTPGATVNLPNPNAVLFERILFALAILAVLTALVVLARFVIWPRLGSILIPVAIDQLTGRWDPLLSSRAKFVNRLLREVPLVVLLVGFFSSRGWTIPRWLKRLSQRAILNPFERAFGVLDQVFRLLGERVAPSMTPTEKVTALMVLLPDASSSGQVLLDEYLQAEYSPHPADLDVAVSASQTIRRMAYRTFFLRLIRQK